MADDRWSWILLGILLGGLLVWFLTRNKVVELTRDEKGHIISILEKTI